MNQFNKELKSAILSSIPEESRLTEFEKQQIREKVSALKGKRSQKPLNLFPRALTAIATAGFLIAASGLVGSELGLFGSGSEEQIKTGNNSFYDGLAIGDKMGDWSLTYKGSSKDGEKGLLVAQFEGRMLLSGTLVYQNKEEGGNLVFVPDSKSAALLPVLDGSLEEITFTSEDQELLANIFGLMPGYEADGAEFEVIGYIAYTKENQKVADVLQLGDIIPTGPERTYTDFSLLTSESGELILENSLQQVYNEFSNTLDDQLLTTLNPFSIFMLYFYAEQRNDYQTQYALYNHSLDTFKPFSSLEEYQRESEKTINIEGKKKLLQKITSTTIMTEEIIGDREAVIWISTDEHLGYALSRDDKGIWKINWTPVQ
jgi:hypothetical protein